MSTLISSAVSGKKAAPKAAPRRRPPPPTAAAKQSTPLSVSSTQTSVAPPSPPPTQPSQTGPAPSQPAETPPPPVSPDQSRAHSLQTEQAPAPSPVLSQSTPVLPTATSNEQSHDQQDDVPPPPSPQTAQKRTAAQAGSKAPTQPPKRVKRSSARSNALAQAQVNEEEAPDTNAYPDIALDPRLAEPTISTSPAPAPTPAPAPASAPAPSPSPTVQRPKKARKSRKKRASNVAESDDGGAHHDLDLLDQQLSGAKPKRRRRTKKSKRRQAESEAEGQQETEGDEQESGSSEAESDPEDHEIDTTTATMLDVTNDKKHGKVSDRERQMAQIDWAEVARKRREEIDTIQAAAQEPPPGPTEEVRETTEGPSGTAEPPPEAPEEPLAPPPEGTANVGGVNFRVVNGQIVADDDDLHIDRQAMAQAEATDAAPVEEENDLTVRINRTTWLHDRRRDAADRLPLAKRKSDPWTEEETDRFYDALATFGTDFYIISNLFQGKNRRHIKAKFTREEKLDTRRVTDALLGRKGTRPTLSLESYAREVGRDVSDFEKYRDFAHAEQEIRDSMREREQEMRDAIRVEEEEEAAAKEAQAEKGRAKKGEKRGGGGGRGRKKKGGGATFGGGGDAEGGG